MLSQEHSKCSTRLVDENGQCYLRIFFCAILGRVHETLRSVIPVLNTCTFVALPQSLREGER